MLAKQEKIRVRSEKFHGGAGLKRWKRSRGFLQFLLDTENYTIITESSRDQSAKSLKQAAMVTGGYYSSNSRRFRAREVAGSEGKERG
jgi:hypothetical protein